MIFIYKHIVCIPLLIILFSTVAAAGDDPVLSVGDDSHYRLGPRLEILEDPGGKLGLEDIQSADQFVRIGKSAPSFGFSDSVFWLRFSLRSTLRSDSTWFLELDYPLMDEFSIFMPDGKKGLLEKRYGTLLPFAGRDINHRNFILKLNLTAGTESTFYMRFKNKDRIEFPMVLWTPRAFYKNMYLEQFILGLYYGILAIMFMYNLFIYFSVKDFSYIFYIPYIFAMALFQLGQSGYFYQVLAGIHDPPPVHFIPYTQAFLIACIIQFSQSYLNTAKYTRWNHFVLNGLKSVAMLYFITPVFLDYTVCIKIGIGLTFLIIPAIIASGLTVMRQGYRPSYYFMSAWSIMFIVGLIFLLRVIAVVPHNLFTSYILHIGTTIELVLLSLGLGDRYNLIKEERDRISNELKIAQKIHNSLIPNGMPRMLGIEAHSEYIPMEEMGGDLFDYHMTGNNCLGVLVADISGHGIPAALVSSMVKISFSLQVHHAHDTTRVMEGMSRILMNQLSGAFVTASYTLIDPGAGEITVSRCGHLPSYLYRARDASIIEMNPRGYLIGRFPAMEIGNVKAQLERGDKVILLTDGIIECRNRENTMFGFDNFMKFVENNNSLPARQFSKFLIDTLRIWIYPDRSFEDDITLVVIDVL